MKKEISKYVKLEEYQNYINNKTYAVLRGAEKIVDILSIEERLSEKKIKKIVKELQELVDEEYETQKKIISTKPIVMANNDEDEGCCYFFVAAAKCLGDLYNNLLQGNCGVTAEDYYTIIGLLNNYDAISIQGFIDKHSEMMNENNEATGQAT